MTVDLIREFVARYLSGTLTGAQLANLLPDGWEMDRAGDVELSEMSLRVLGHLSEFEAGDISEAALRARLSELVGVVTRMTFSATQSQAVEISSPMTKQVVGAGK